MTSALTVRRAPARFAPMAGAALALALAACSSAPPPAPPPPAPPPVAVAPSISLSPRVIELASAYRAYVTRAAAISPGFATGADVAQSLKTGESYEPNALLRGAIAYGAVVALQDPAYVAGVRRFVGDPDQRRTVAYEIMKDPAYAVGFSGSASAAGMVMNALGEDGRKLVELGRNVRKAAYDVQHQAWSKSDVPARDTRLALAKELSATPGLGEVAETARLQSAISGPGQMGLTPASADPPYTPEVIHALAVAALAALGYADDNSLGQIMPILAEPAGGVCLNMAKLNLYQCLAVARPHYEDVFCLGQHVLEDTGSCLMKGAGVAAPADPRAQALADAALTKTSTPPTSRSKSKKRPSSN